MRPLVVGLMLAVAAAASSASAQTPAGGEVRVNTYTSDDQRDQWVAVAPDGRFVVGWESYGQDGSFRGVYAQRFDAAGARLGAEFRVNTYTSLSQQNPAVAFDGRGAFVLVWQSNMQDGDDYGIFGRRFDPAGNALGAEFRVNGATTGFQGVPALAVAPAGNFMVTWDAGQYGSGYGVFARRFDASGTAVGADFHVNTSTTGDQYASDVAADSAGRFVVVWTSYPGQDGAAGGVFARRFAASGGALGVEFGVNSYTSGDQQDPRVARAPDGRFFVVWDGPGDGSQEGIFGQRFDAAGNRMQGEFRVNAYTGGVQRAPSVAVDALGNFVVAWESPQDGSRDGIALRRFSWSGNPRRDETITNTSTLLGQERARVGSDAVGNLVVTWQSDGQDGSLLGIYGQRLGGLTPASLDVDPGPGPLANGNRVLEQGETAAVQTGWRNLNGATLLFEGLLSEPPPGSLALSVPDQDAAFGPVPSGNAVTCITDCYAVRVAGNAVRPGQHWDVAFDELLMPAEAHGQAKRWTLHVGDSFGDVPRSNPFYRFVETLLHRSITGGCGPGQYCPGASTTRDAMAVFVLVAKEGPGYAPPACGAPLFADVPAASPFCRFVEELARRGVVSGCGGGNYCPGDAVTREQMAVFVLRTLDPALSPPACATPVFADVPAGSPFCRWIEELARRGVVSGCGNGNYCPAQPVTREQVGVFLTATFALSLYGV